MSAPCEGSVVIDRTHDGEVVTVTVQPALRVENGRTVVTDEPADPEREPG